MRFHLPLNNPNSRITILVVAYILVFISMKTKATPPNLVFANESSPETQIAYFHTSMPRTAVTLVANGLNVRPMAMIELIKWLNSKGSDVYLVNLSGHGGGSGDIASVTAQKWEKDMLRGYELASNDSRNSPAPLYFLGYSLGALLGEAMIQFVDTGIPFDKQVLIAPATAIRNRSYILKLLFVLGEKITLRSYTPGVYSANARLPLKVYKILFRKEKALNKSRCTKLNIPTLVLIDPKDEVISYRKLKRHRKKFALSDHEIMPLDSDLKTRDGKYQHHLIIDEVTMGKQNWDETRYRLNDFLFLR